MKNVLGLLIALSLALLACVLNWKYLERKSQEVETVAFLAVGESVRIRQGDAFRDEHFVPVNIPRNQLGQLEQSAVLFADRPTVIGMKAVRAYEGGEIVLRQDLKTPPGEMTLAENERAMWIPVDVGSYVPSLIVPGDLVSFIVPKSAPAASDPESETGFTTAASASGNEIVGPFRLPLGGRLGSDEVYRASGAGNAQENVMGIAVRVDGEALESRAQKLFDRLQQGDFRRAGVLLHPRKK